MEYNGYVIEHDPVYAMKVIKPVGRGSVHNDLRGMFTRTTDAQKAIDAHLAIKEMEKEEDDGKVSIRRRSKPV